jgi:hypothetical protein
VHPLAAWHTPPVQTCPELQSVFAVQAATHVPPEQTWLLEQSEFSVQ